MYIGRVVGSVVSLLFPGTGQLLAGAPKRGSRTLAAAVALLLIAGAGTVWPLPRGTLPLPGSWWAVTIPLVLYCVMAVASARAYLRFSDRALAVGNPERRTP